MKSQFSGRDHESEMMIEIGGGRASALRSGRQAPRFLVISWCLLGSLALLAGGCSGSAETGGKVLGESCDSSLVGGLFCGEGEQSYMVMDCREVGSSYIWMLKEECLGECELGVCKSMFQPQDTVQVQEDVDSGFRFGDQDTQDFWTWDTDIASDLIGPQDLTPEVGQCTNGQTDCLDHVTMMLCNSGVWENQICDSGLVCAEGQCRPIICTPGESTGTCTGQASYGTCNESGTGIIDVVCEAPRTCYLGQCVDYKCPPDEIACKGVTGVQECKPTEDGLSYDWVVTEICDNGLCVEGQCISACEVNIKENSYLGCDYWAVDLDNTSTGMTQPVAVVISAPEDGGEAGITITDMSLEPPTNLLPSQLGVDFMSVAPGDLKIFMLPNNHDIDGTSLTRKSFRIKSDTPVTVHQFNPLNGAGVFTNDASLLLPTNLSGEEYLAMSWGHRIGSTPQRGFITIIAMDEEPTQLQIWPTAAVVAGVGIDPMAAAPEEPYIFTLQEGQVLNLETAGPQGADLTGTRILADKKVTVFGGHECANVPLNVNYCDHIEQQLFPVNTWGSHYIADGFQKRNDYHVDTWRVIAGEDGVDVSFKPAVASTYENMTKGQMIEFTTGVSFEVSASGPVMVGHYLQGSNYPNYSGSNDVGDPAFTLAVPIQQYLDSYVFLTPATYIQDYVNISAPMDCVLTLDGEPIEEALTEVGTSGYGVLQLSVPDGVHTISGSAPFGLTVYGYDDDVSYAYPGGLRLSAIQD